MKRITSCLMIFLSILALPACAKETADPRRDPDQVRLEAPKMSRAALEDMARGHADAIAAKRDESVKLQMQIKDIALAGQFSDKAVALKEKAGKLSAEISGHNILYDIYMHYYLEKGGDYEKIKLNR